jgi:hypothetical protein
VGSSATLAEVDYRAQWLRLAQVLSGCAVAALADAFMSGRPSYALLIFAAGGLVGWGGGKRPGDIDGASLRPPALDRLPAPPRMPKGVEGA